MADIKKTLSQLMTDYADNNAGAITPQLLRNGFNTVVGSMAVSAVTSNYPATGDDIFLNVIPSGSDITVTLPNVLTFIEKYYIIKNSGTSNNVIVAGSIDGATNYTLLSGQVLAIESNGTTWVSYNKPTDLSSYATSASVSALSADANNKLYTSAAFTKTSADALYETLADAANKAYTSAVNTQVNNLSSIYQPIGTYITSAQVSATYATIVSVSAVSASDATKLTKTSADTLYQAINTTLTKTSADTLYAPIGTSATINNLSATYVPLTIIVSAGNGLTGGGSLSANQTISLPNVGTAGTYFAIVTDAYGRVTSGMATITSANIPTLAYLPLSGGTLTGPFAVGALGFSDTGIILSLTSAISGYQQLVIRNSSSATNASTDVIVANDQTTSSLYYGDLGMNSSQFSGSGSLNLPNAVYLYSSNGDLVLATSTSGTALHLLTSGALVDALTITSANKLNVPMLSASSYLKTDLNKNITTGPILSSDIPSVFITSVTHDSTLSGSGTSAFPLSVTVSLSAGIENVNASGGSEGNILAYNNNQWVAQGNFYNWDNTATIIYTSASGWNSTENAVNTSSAEWNSVYTSVSATSANMISTQTSATTSALYPTYTIAVVSALPASASMISNCLYFLLG